MNRILLTVLMATSLMASACFAETPKWSPEEVLRAYILSHYPWQDVQLINVKLNAAAPVEAPSRIAVENNPPGRTTFVLYFDNGPEIKASVEVRAIETVVLPRYPMLKGHVLEAADLYTTGIDIAKLQAGVVRDAKRAVGRQLARTIGPGKPLTEDMLGAASGEIVKKGSKVALVAMDDSLKVTVLGELKEEGYVGKTVKVRNLSSDKVVTGVLIDEDTVKVGF